MFKALTRRIVTFVLALSFLGTTSLQPAMAAMISTETALATEQRMQQIDRVQEFLQRDAVQQQLVELGVSPQAASERVANLTDTELAQINGQLDQLPAGAGVVGVIGVVFIVLLILEVLGVTNVFTKI